MTNGLTHLEPRRLDPSPSSTHTPRRDAWSPVERLAFRFVFVYFAMFGCASLLDIGPAPRKLLDALSLPPVRWVARSLFHIDGAASIGGPRWAAAQQITALAIAALIAGLWSMTAQRTEYRRLRGWFLIALRYYVAVVMLVYGGFKVVDSQFPPLQLEHVAQPLGSLAPMGLLWAFMGYSSVYASFTGIGEALGAFLLFFRRTTTAGALILIAVLSNVALLNYTFDVPVKQLSSNLLFAAIVLAATDAKRIIDVFLLNRAPGPANVSFDFRRRWIYTVRRFLKPIIIVVATSAPLVISSVVHARLVRTPPLFGVYDVEEFIRGGRPMPPLATDTTRWRQLVVGRGDIVSVRFMNDSLRSFAATIDSVAHRITLRERGPSPASMRYDYQLLDGGLRLRGLNGGDSIDVTLRRLDLERAFRLLRRR